MTSLIIHKTNSQIWQSSFQESKKWSNHKIKIAYYVYCLICTLNKLYANLFLSLFFLISPFFRFWGRNLSNFCGGFLKNLRHQKYILKLTDLYSCPLKITSNDLLFLLGFWPKGSGSKVPAQRFWPKGSGPKVPAQRFRPKDTWRFTSLFYCLKPSTMPAHFHLVWLNYIRHCYS